MTWYLYEPGMYPDAAQLDAGVGKDIIVNNLREIYVWSPAVGGCPIDTGETTGLVSGNVTSFGSAGAMMARFPLVFLRGQGQHREVRSLSIECWAGMVGGGGTGTLRMVVGPTWHVPANPPVEPDLYDDTAGGAVTTTYGWHTLQVDLTPEQVSYLRLGGGFDYPCVCVTILGIRATGSSGQYPEIQFMTEGEVQTP